MYIPFLACGDLTGYDSDRSYPLPKVDGGTYQSLDPVQPPIAPPYKRALELKKASSQGLRELENLSLDSWSCNALFIHNAIWNFVFSFSFLTMIWFEDRQLSAYVWTLVLSFHLYTIIACLASLLLSQFFNRIQIML